MGMCGQVFSSSLRKRGKQDLDKLIKREIIYMICVLLETSGKDAKNQTGYHHVKYPAVIVGVGQRSCNALQINK